MTAKEALKHLGVTRKTLDKYVKEGKIRVSKYNMPHKMGWNNYWDEDVYALVGRGLRSKGREIVAYVRVKGNSQEANAKMDEQKRSIKQFMQARGVQLDRVYEDRSDSITVHHGERPALSELLEACLRKEVAAVIIDTRCRISRFAFDAYEHIFRYGGVEVIIVNKVLGDPYYQSEQSDDIAKVLEQAKIDRLGAKGE